MSISIKFAKAGFTRAFIDSEDTTLSDLTTIKNNLKELLKDLKKIGYKDSETLEYIDKIIVDITNKQGEFLIQETIDFVRTFIAE